MGALPLIPRTFPILSLLIIVAMCVTPRESRAHEFSPERGVIAQMAQDTLAIMLTYRETNPQRVRLVMGRYDLDRNGRLEGLEAQLAGQVLLGLALHGITFEVKGVSPRARNPQIKFQPSRDGALDMAALVVYDLPALSPKSARTLRIAISDAPRTLPVVTIAQAMGDVRLISIGGQRRAATKRAGPFTLGHTADVDFVFVLPARDDP